jgi:FtsH-binding integral membrane protein
MELLWGIIIGLIISLAIWLPALWYIYSSGRRP